MPRKVAKRAKPARVREGRAQPRWLSRAQLDSIHQAQISEHGGSAGVRDEGLLESALARARNKFAYGETDISTLAAAYAFGIAKNHGYGDGNKRTALVATGVFLLLNGHELVAHEPEVVDVMNRLASGKLTEAAFATWVKAHITEPRGDNA